MSIQDAASLVGVSVQVIRDAVNRQNLPAKRLGHRTIRIKVSDLESWFDQLDDARP